MDNTQRFSNRVGDYAKYRPSYPEAAIHFLLTTVGLGPDCALADIGAGTGILTGLLAPAVQKVYAVEPNGPMRTAAAQALKAFPHCLLVDAPAEATTLPDQCVDFVTCAQAFHWFDRARCRVEFARILKPGGRVVILWNHDQFGPDYEQIRRTWCRDFTRVGHRRLTQTDYQAFFPLGYTSVEFAGVPQRFLRPEFLGRVMSSSCAPMEGEPNHRPFLEAMEGYFLAHACGQRIELQYKTEIIWGRLS